MYFYDKDTPAAGTASIQRNLRDVSKYSTDWFSLERCKQAQPFLYPKSKCKIQLENGRLSKVIRLQVLQCLIFKALSIKAVQQGELCLSDKLDQTSFYLGLSVTIAPHKVFIPGYQSHTLQVQKNKGSYHWSTVFACKQVWANHILSAERN
jgi:hypothetical protein